MNKISWFFSCCILIGKSISAPDVALVLQKLPTDNTRYNMTCVLTGENLNSGIAWIQPIDIEKTKTYESQYVPEFYKEYSCKIDSKSSCSIYWTRNDWQIQNSYKVNLDVVTDERWEDLEEIFTDGDTVFQHVQTFSNDTKNKLTINFAIRVQHEAHIFLCNDRYPDKANCYWILLGGFSGRKTAIRKCRKQIPDSLTTYPKEPCKDIQQEILITPGEFLSTNEWKHFSISINERNIVMKSVSNNVILLNWSDTGRNRINIRHLIVRSNHVPAHWKFNQYEFTYTANNSVDETPQLIGEIIKIMDSKLCISFYVAMCAQCSLIISGVNLRNSANDNILKKTIHPLKEFTWQQVKLSMSFPTSELDIQLYEERHCSNNCHEQFWAIDAFRLCTDNEVRVLNVDGNALQSSFQILVTSSRNMNLKLSTSSIRDAQQFSDSTCPIGNIGSTTCTSCSQIFGENKKNCEASIICDYSINTEGTCRCSPGYTGNTCTDRCPKSRYGSGCKESCGFCEYKECNFITGICTASQQCLSHFQGPQCKIPPYPVLTNTPILIGSGYNQIVIQIPDFTSHGMGEPVKYKVTYELTKDNNTRYETDSFPIFNPSPKITLSSLLSDTSYTIRVVLLTSEDKFYNGTFSVPTITASTTCSDIQERDVNITTTNNSSVIISFRNDPELCPIQNYEIKFETNVLFDGGNDNEFHIPNLVPDTDYTITITNKNKSTAILYCHFRTKEEAPSVVQSPEVISSNATSLTVSWTQPVKLNGKLRHYKINLKHYRYLACDEIDNTIQKIETFEHQSTTITLNNLIPFSEYSIEIAGVTIEVGEFSSITGRTDETNTPDELETPTQVDVQPFNTTAQITLKQANCSLIKGNIEYYITARCTSEWCKNRTTTSNTNYYLAKENFNVTGLFPYSTYIMDIKVGRTNGNLYNRELLPTSFNTLPSAPNAAEFKIYEESRDILRLRIDPPHPPTGELEQYFVKYCLMYTCQSRILNCKETYFEAVACKLWPKYHCLDISENLEGNKWYRVYVQARNKNISDLGNETYECERTTQRNSYPPTELSASWDDYYNLTLQWNHPNITNGPLTKFGITILKMNNICNRSNYMVSKETTRLTYDYVVSINNQDCYTSELTVLIQSFNENEGSIATLHIDSPPETPTLNTFVENVSNTTITIALSAKNLQPPRLFSKSYMYIVLSESKSKFEVDNVEDALYSLQNLETLLHAWLIAEYDLNTKISLETNLTIGSNNSNYLSQGDVRSSEIKLIPNTSYTITILMYNEYRDRKRYRVYEIVKSTSGTTISSNSINSALFSLILIVLLPLLLWIYIRKRKTGNWCSCISNTSRMPLAFKARVQGNPDVIPLTKNPSISTKQILAPKPRIPSRNASSNSNITIVNDNRIINKFSKPIRITDFDKYVKDAITNGELERQHSLFVRGQTKPWDYGALPQNKSKNRYNNLIAYDHTRVKLEKINDDPYSDYINANYIDGYKSKKAYIATQGPKVATLNDFWRMIWQDNVKYIVMLANVVEGGKKKTEQYWPNINETIQYGNVSVKYKSTEVSADYEYRTFSITSNDIERQIEQLHFTSWPDHGVPMYSQSLVPLFKKLLTISQGNSPIVVHCSAGVGRTGTVILCDLCLRMSAHESVIDVLKHQHKIREQRANLVDNVEQYKLVHLVLLECLINPVTSITCDEEAEKNILRLLESDKLEKQFHYISEIAWQDEAMRPSLEVNQKPEWKLKNRVEDITTSGCGRVYLSRYPITDEHSDYINAVEVDGFKAPNKFIVTQQPLPNTISDFWRMIDEKDISTIVSLNSINKDNNRSCVFWPTVKISEIQPVPYLSIKFVNKISNEEITIINLQLHSKNNKDIPIRDINLIKLKDWPADQLLPNSNVSLLKLWNETEKLSQDTHPIVVTCYDGATSCGLFLAFTFTMEKIKLEHQCDVCLAVRTIRHNREQFVQSLDQFKYLYRAAIAYLNSFELYANFS